MITFGPVPSRRLGRSLGINTIPPKVCSYSCTYCQVGFTTEREIARREFLSPQEVSEAAASHVSRVRERGEEIDYLTIVPDGEPTLDVQLGETIRALRPLGFPVAVISNGSLVWDPEVRGDLAEADWVSLKVDAVDEPVWRRVNRPHPDLDLHEVLDGVARFAGEYAGELCSETMLVAGVNDREESVDAVAGFLSGLPLATAYLAVPTRPPASGDALPPDESVVTSAYRAFERRLPRVELLVGYEGDAFAASGDPASDLLAITAVHPMRASAVEALLARTGASWRVVDGLVESGELVGVEHGGERFYVRSFARRRGRPA